ncbi:MAG: Carboxypeptidase G2 [Paracidovorax wautersii]|uniref:Carboxypeptidase G2 n=1 Tax=Paracidovorax wautersii TaxID=1177982 RepID=A0A7V8FQ21_9BURK|nr:MAG: Carboxypeptidase G2 [Paracidovorax wautersii]
MSALPTNSDSLPTASIPVLDPWLQDLQAWIECESPSADTGAVTRMVALVEARAQALGLRTSRITLDGTPAPALVASNRAEGDERPGILIIGHLDTVHPVGTLARNAWRAEGDQLYGPGIYDMKAGVYLALQALGAVSAPGATRLPVDLLLVPDEEIGSLHSRPLTESLARRARYGLVCEPARANTGFCVTARKGTGMLRVVAHGRPSHAGVAHEKGRSAIREIGHQILAIEAMTDYAQGVTVSIGTIEGGTTRNVVPSRCELFADFRVPDMARGQALLERMRALRPHDPDVRLEIEADMNRPPMEPTPATAELLARAQGVAQQSGWTLAAAPMTGGGSDANFAAAVGLPSLDGLGPDGDGAHTLYEHILVSTMAQRLAFWQRMLRELD